MIEVGFDNGALAEALASARQATGKCWCLWGVEGGSWKRAGHTNLYVAGRGVTRGPLS